MASGKEYKIAFKLAAELESSFASIMGKVETDFKGLEKQIKDIQPLRLSGEIVRGLHDDVKTLVTKMREVDALRIGAGVMKPLKDDIKDARDELHRLGSMRLSGDITRALEANVDGLETKLRAISHLRIGANVFENMKRDIADVDRQMRALQSIRITGEIVRPIRTDLETLERQLREIVRMNGPRGTFQEMKDDLKVVLPDLREMKRLLTEITRIRMPPNQFGGDIERYVRQIRDLEAEMRRIQNMRGPSPPSGGGSGDPSGDGGGPSILALGSGGLMAGAAAIGGAVMIGKAGDEYQRAMNQIQASTGTTVADMAVMKDVAKGLYNQNLGEDWSDLAQVIGRVKQVTGQTGATLQDTSRNAIVLRDTFEGLDIQESIKAADTMMKNFGITADQAYNLIAQGAQRGLDKSGELLDSANEYAPYFAKLGFTAEGMFDTFSAGLAAGAFNLDKVGDGIKEFGIRTKDGSKASMAAYKALGLNGQEMTNAFAKGGKVAQEAFLKTSKAIASVKDPVLANATSVQLFGTQAEDLEARVIKAYSNVKKTFNQNKDTIGEIAKINYSSFGQALKGIGRQLNTSLIIPLVDAALPALGSFSNWFAAAGPKVSGFFKQMGGSKGFAQVKSFAADAIENVKYLFENGFDGEMVGVTENYAKMLGMDPAAAAGVGKKAQVLFKGVQAAVAQFRSWIGPATEQARAIFQKVFVAIGGYIKQAIPIVLRIGSIAIQAFQQVVGAIAPFVAYLYGKLQPIVSAVFGFIANTAIPGLLNAFNTVLPHIQGVVALIGPLMTATFNAIKPTIDAIVAAFQWAWPLVSAAVKWAVDTIGPVIGGLLDALGGIITFLTGVFSGNWSQAWSGIVQTFGGIWSGLKAMVAGPINAVVRMVNNAIDSINSFKVDMPEVLGGGTIGFNIGHIPEIGGGESKSSGSSGWGSTGKQQSAGRMQAFARGGIADQASIFGEAGPEMAIPLNNSPRSHSLLEQTNRMMGHDTGGSQAITIEYSPQIIIQGNADAAVVKQAQDDGYSEFKQHMDRYFKQQRRVSFG